MKQSLVVRGWALPALALLAATATDVDAEVVFESSFDEDVGYSVGRVKNWHQDEAGNTVAPPTGFGGVRVSEGGSLSVVDNGEGGNALKIVYGDTGTGRSSLTLGAHLTGDPDVGYDELYVRYRIKLPPNFKAGYNGQNMAFWKWGRLWQNTDLTYAGNWTENRADSGYVVWGVYPGFRGKKNFAAAFADNQSENGNQALGSNGGPFQQVSWRLDGDASTLDAHFQGVGDGAWALDPNNPGFLVDRQSQRFHTLEWRFKLASGPGAEDGGYEMWIDGEKQIEWTTIGAAYQAPDRSGISTLAVPNEPGRGWNHLSVFDNLQSWADDWDQPGVDGYFLLDDVVVSTTRIGHDYRAGTSYP